eukprot:58711-Chlamydomonas_euryale.AAC.2
MPRHSAPVHTPCSGVPRPSASRTLAAARPCARASAASASTPDSATMAATAGSASAPAANSARPSASSRA